MLVYGALLGCVDPILTIAAAMALSRHPFLSPADRRQEANAARKHLCTEMSDQLALLRAYEGWEKERERGGAGAARAYCERLFLSNMGMEEWGAIREQLANTLRDVGLPHATQQRQLHKIPLVRAIVTAGLYPQLLKIKLPESKFVATASGAREQENSDARALRFFVHGGERERAFLHPSSALFGAARFPEQCWLVYHSKQRTSKLFIRDASLATPMALLLFGGDLSIDHHRQTVTLDKTITFGAPSKFAVHVRELRAELDTLLLRKIDDPSLEIAGSKVLEAMCTLINTENLV